MKIRKCDKKDYPFLRELAWQTADAGQPLEGDLSLRELITDLITNYYLKYEPESIWVIEDQDRLAGYLTGSLDSYRYDRQMTYKVLPQIIFKSLFRGLFFKKPFRLWLIAGIKTYYRSGHYRKKYYASYPAHFHINLTSSYRGQGLGYKLAGQFINQLRENGIRGCHIAVRSDNQTAITFFEKLGFILMEKKDIYLPGSSGLKYYKILIYGKKIEY